LFASLVLLTATTKKKKEKKRIKTGASSGHITILSNLFWRLSISMVCRGIGLAGYSIDIYGFDVKFKEKMTSPGGKLTAQVCQLTKKVNKI
jgi:hypothetical protein